METRIVTLHRRTQEIIAFDPLLLLTTVTLANRDLTKLNRILTFLERNELAFSAVEKRMPMKSVFKNPRNFFV